MAYAIQYRLSARQSLNDCQATYGACLAGPVQEWLKRLAHEADGGTYRLSIDAWALFEAVANNPNPTAWTRASKVWLNAPLMTKIRAIVAILSTRRPPWEFRAASETLQFLGTCSYEATVFYDIDHVERRIIVTTLDLPPGSPGP